MEFRMGTGGLEAEVPQWDIGT